MDPRIQQILARLANFVEDVQYIPEGGTVPAGYDVAKYVSSRTGGELVIAIKPKPDSGAIIDLILGFV